MAYWLLYARKRSHMLGEWFGEEMFEKLYSLAILRIRRSFFKRYSPKAGISLKPLHNWLLFLLCRVRVVGLVLTPIRRLFLALYKPHFKNRFWKSIGNL
jgi:hypothetical protein